MISSKDAWQLVAQHPFEPTVEEVPLSSAHGRRLAKSVRASRPFPAFDRVMMDGIAFKAAVLGPDNSLPITGCTYAGQAPVRLTEGHATEVMTGAVLPPGADTVVQVERITIEQGRVHIEGEIKPGSHIHPEGSDRALGALLLEAGTHITPGATGILASEGFATVPVFSLPKCTIVSTGDELVPVTCEPLAHQIRSSNREVLQHMLALRGIDASLLHVPDDLPQMVERFTEALAHSDVILLSGGVSKGKKDHVPDLLVQLGATIHFHRVAQRPGKPMLFATLGKTVVFGLPGNPLSATFSAGAYVLPWLGLSDPQLDTPQTVKLSEALRFAPVLTRFFPVTVANQGGELMATPLAHQGSGDLSAIAGASGIVCLEAETTDFPPGTLVPYYPFY